MSLAQREFRKSQAPGPCTSIFEKEVSSKRAAVSRVARTSAAMAGDQLSSAQPLSSGTGAERASFLLGVYQFGRSQPPFSPKTAPRSCNLWYAGERRSGRADSRSSYGI